MVVSSYARRTDENQVEIVRVLRDNGRRVFPTHRVAGGFPDLVVGYRGKTHLIEVKKDKKQNLTADQVDFIADWEGSPVHVVTSAEEALRATQ